MEITVDFTDVEVPPPAKPTLSDGPRAKKGSGEGPLNRRRVVMPEITDDITHDKDEVRDKLESSSLAVHNHTHLRLPKDLVEAAKATFIATGGNISEVAATHDLTPESVLRLAQENEWPVYEGGTTSLDKMNRARLKQLHERLWHKMEKMLDSLGVEEKQKQDIVQHRMMSEYVEPLASRNSTFKTLLDQYMRIGTILYPELYGLDPANSNSHAARLQANAHPNAIGGVEGVNREIADFLGKVVVGMADELKRRDEEQHDIIEAEVLE